MATHTPPSGRTLDFDKLPDSSFIDVRAVAGVFDISTATVWRWAAIGLLPKPEKLRPATTRWQVGALRQHRAKQAEAA